MLRCHRFAFLRLQAQLDEAADGFRARHKRLVSSARLNLGSNAGSVAGATRPIVSYAGYFFDFAGRSRTRFTTDCGRRNMRAIAAGFMPVE
jgi:hypothetical protein